MKANHPQATNASTKTDPTMIGRICSGPPPPPCKTPLPSPHRNVNGSFPPRGSCVFPMTAARGNDLLVRRNSTHRILRGPPITEQSALCGQSSGRCFAPAFFQRRQKRSVHRERFCLPLPSSRRRSTGQRRDGRPARAIGSPSFPCNRSSWGDRTRNREQVLGRRTKQRAARNNVCVVAVVD